jgi:hypothetical protein
MASVHTIPDFEKNIAIHHEIAPDQHAAEAQNDDHEPRSETEAYENRDIDFRTIMAIIVLLSHLTLPPIY